LFQNNKLLGQSLIHLTGIWHWNATAKGTATDSPQLEKPAAVPRAKRPKKLLPAAYSSGLFRRGLAVDGPACRNGNFML